MNWLFKEEPGSYSFSHLVKDGGTTWSGVKNPLAQKHLRAVHQGDRILYYHTGSERAIVGTALAASDPYPDPADKTKRRVAVDIAPVAAFASPVGLAAIKAHKSFASHPLVRMGRLSVMPITDAELAVIERLARGPRD